MASLRPFEFRFDLYAVCFQLLFPRHKSVAAGGETDVTGTMRAVRWNRYMGVGRWVRRYSGVKHQQHLVAAAIKQVTPFLLGLKFEAKEAGIEGFRPVEVVGV